MNMTVNVWIGFEYTCIPVNVSDSLTHAHEYKYQHRDSHDTTCVFPFPLIIVLKVL